ncbi:MAG: hypothetical protein LUH04_11580 [Clostridium sp.]|nr:hypothetical protein [Clostridium sp.]
MSGNSREINMKQADAYLEGIREPMAGAYTEELVYRNLRACINLRFGIGEETETDFRKLAIISIKRRDLSERKLPEAVLEKRIHQYDCHQTSLVTQMKVLFVMYVERKLGICLEDDEVTAAEDLRAFSRLVFRAMAKKE